MEELVLVDIATERLEGEAMDLCHGPPFLTRTDLRAGTIEEAGKGSDAVVTSAGTPQRPGEPRLGLTEKNAALFRRIVPPVARHCPEAVLLVVSNPVDVLTQTAGVLSGFPPTGRSAPARCSIRPAFAWPSAADWVWPPQRSSPGAG